MEENFITLKKDNILRIGIKDQFGNDTGEHLEFDLESVDTLLKYNESIVKHQKNLEFLRNKFVIINKQKDEKINSFMTKNEKAKLEVLKEFYKREMEALDLFLGKGGTRKMLNGRSPYYDMFDDIAESLEPIMPKFKLKADDITNKIKEKYSNKKEENVL